MIHPTPLVVALVVALCATVPASHAGRDGGPLLRSADTPWQHPAHDARLLTKKWDELSPEEKRRVREAKERYRSLPEDKQERLREKWENMPKKERDKYKLERRYQ